MYDATSVTDAGHPLPLLPTAPCTETITWKTRIFHAADGTEVRAALLPYPNYSLTYNFTFGYDTKLSLDVMRAQLSDVRWLLPLVYQMRPLSRTYQGRTAPAFPMSRYVALVSPECGNIVYTRLSELTRPHDLTLTYGNPLSRTQLELLDRDDLFVCPCVTASIESAVSTSIVGSAREGDEMAITWRWDGWAEGELHYTAAFDFTDAVQSPASVTDTSPQVDFGDDFSPVHRYKPDAILPRQGSTTSVNYWLNTGAQRDDYFFRGALLMLMGGQTAANLIYSDALHRLSGDQVTIKYDQRIATASLSAKEVTA